MQVGTAESDWADKRGNENKKASRHGRERVKRRENPRKEERQGEIVQQHRTSVWAGKISLTAIFALALCRSYLCCSLENILEKCAYVYLYMYMRFSRKCFQEKRKQEPQRESVLRRKRVIEPVSV